MQALRVPILLCFVAVAYGFPSSNTYIVGGQDAPVGMFPYQVSLRLTGSHFCGGSIINSRYILTAAHCVYGTNDLKSTTVHAGTNLANSPGITYGVEKIVIHRGFNLKTLVDDVALIRVNKNIAFNNLVKTIPLAAGNNTFERSSCTLSGWGMLRVNGEAANRLQYIHLLVDTQSHCKQVHKEVTDSQICTFTKFGEGACYGDSGGPLVANGQQIGIVSFGQPCGIGYPDVYTRVSFYNSWIQQQQTYIQNGEVGNAPEDAIYIV